MAMTTSLLANTVLGNQRVIFARLTPDATSTSFVTGLEFINAFTVAIQSATTANPGFTMNEGPGGTAIAGEFHMSGVASGDEYVCVFYGR